MNSLEKIVKLLNDNTQIITNRVDDPKTLELSDWESFWLHQDIEGLINSKITKSSPGQIDFTCLLDMGNGTSMPLKLNAVVGEIFLQDNNKYVCTIDDVVTFNHLIKWMVTVYKNNIYLNIYNFIQGIPADVAVSADFTLKVMLHNDITLQLRHICINLFECQGELVELGVDDTVIYEMLSRNATILIESDTLNTTIYGVELKLLYEKLLERSKTVLIPNDRLIDIGNLTVIEFIQMVLKSKSRVVTLETCLNSIDCGLTDKLITTRKLM